MRRVTGDAIETTDGSLDCQAFAAVGDDRARQEIRFANEVCDRLADGTLVDFARRADLQDVPGVENRHPVGDGERFLLVVRDVNGREFELLADAANFRAHLKAEFGIEIGERLVEQQAARPDDERAGERDALLLAAGELIGFAVGVGAHAHGLERLAGAAPDFVLRHLALLEAERDVLRHGHVRPQRVALKHHSGIPLVRREASDVFVAKNNFPRVGQVETREAAQQRRLAAAARPKEEEKLAGIDR